MLELKQKRKNMLQLEGKKFCINSVQLPFYKVTKGKTAIDVFLKVFVRFLNVHSFIVGCLLSG